MLESEQRSEPVAFGFQCSSAKPDFFQKEHHGQTAQESGEAEEPPRMIKLGAFLVTLGKPSNEQLADADDVVDDALGEDA